MKKKKQWLTTRIETSTSNYDCHLLRPCERRLLPKFSFLPVSEMSVFRKLGLERVVRAFSELVPTRENLFRLVPILIFAKNCVFCEFRKLPFSKNSSWDEFFELFPNSSRLAKTRSNSKLDSKVRIKVRNAGPYCLVLQSDQN